MTATQTIDLGILQIIIQSGVTVAAVSVAIYLIKKWMNDREVQENLIKEDAKKTSRDLVERHDASCVEIKKQIMENRNFYERTYFDLKKDIGDVFELQRIANGRTGKLETALAILQKSHCALEDRTGKMERATDKL